jgi:hypothetical protein
MMAIRTSLDLPTAESLRRLRAGLDTGVLPLRLEGTPVKVTPQLRLMHAVPSGCLLVGDQHPVSRTIKVLFTHVVCPRCAPFLHNLTDRTSAAQIASALTILDARELIRRCRRSDGMALGSLRLTQRKTEIDEYHAWAHLAFARDTGGLLDQPLARLIAELEQVHVQMCGEPLPDRRGDMRMVE